MGCTVFQRLSFVSCTHDWFFPRVSMVELQEGDERRQWEPRSTSKQDA